MAKKELDLAAELALELNKINKDQKVAYFLGDNDAPTNVNGWVSTGAAMLDLAISNRAYGGLPIGRITEITGLEQSGKSLVSAHLLADTQKQGGIAVLIDTENAVSTDFLEAIGVDVSKLLYVAADSVEQVFDYTETIIEKVRSTQKDKKVTIVVDSVAAASTTDDSDSDDVLSTIVGLVHAAYPVRKNTNDLKVMLQKGISLLTTANNNALNTASSADGINYLDTNKDGKIDQKEMVTAYLNVKKKILKAAKTIIQMAPMAAMMMGGMGDRDGINSDL